MTVKKKSVSLSLGLGHCQPYLLTSTGNGPPLTVSSASASLHVRFTDRGHPTPSGNICKPSSVPACSSFSSPPPPPFRAKGQWWLEEAAWQSKRRAWGLACPPCELDRVSSHAYQFPRAVVTKYHRPRGLKPQNLIFSQFWGPKSDIKVSAGHAPCSKGSRGRSTLTSSSLSWLLAFRGLWQHRHDLCPWLPIVFFPVCADLFSLMKTPVLGCRAHPQSMGHLQILH